MLPLPEQERERHEESFRAGRPPRGTQAAEDGTGIARALNRIRKEAVRPAFQGCRAGEEGMDVHSLSVVRAIVAEGSYQKAAQRLHCSQSTVSFQVRQLENELSVRLFERIGRRMVLSRAGGELLPHMESILFSMQQILQYGSGRRELVGDLRIAVAESLLSYRVHRILGAFVREAPRVRLQLHCLNCHDIRDGILAGEYDMGVYYDVGGHTSTLALTALGTAEGIIVASPDLPPELADFTTPHQEKDVSFIINEPRSIYRERMEAYLRSRHILLRNTMELRSIEAIKKTVAGNLGVSFLPRFAVERELAEGSLVELPSAMRDNTVEIICVRHRNREPAPAMLLFMDLLARSLLRNS